jgi:guanylate kinase
MSSEIVLQEATRLVDESLSSRGMLVVVSSPSGGGKGTLIRRALKSVPNLGYSVSFTTRAARAGEVDGRDYFFVSSEAFNEMTRAGEFLEWACVHGNYYGTAWSQVERELLAGRDIILEIDVQGAASVRKLIPGAIEIFILPPSFEVLRKRLIGRGSELPADLELRLKNARDEVEHYREFDYVIINDDLENAAKQLSSIVVSERVRRDRQESPAKRVIATFPSGD